MPLFLAALLSLALCLANDIIDNSSPPIGIELTPLVILAITLILNTTTPPRQVVVRVVITALLVCLQDAGIRLYGGGMHDLEGLGFITAALALGLLPAWLLLLILLSRATRVSLGTKLTAAIALPLVVGAYLCFFGEIGLGRYYEGGLLQ